MQNRLSCPLWLVPLLVVNLAAMAQESPYDVLHRAYAPYLSADEPLALPLKMQSLATSPYKFWRGSKDLFLLWCKTSATDWLADREAFVDSHADLHFGNIGTYPSDRGLNKLAFGMVDFDDAAMLPFQIELLHGLVTFELTAAQNGFDFSDSQRRALLDEMLSTYRTALNSQRSATALLTDAGDSTVAALLAKNTAPYDDELARFTVDGRFRRSARNERGKVTDILQPAMVHPAEIAKALADAVENEPDLKRRFRYRGAQEFESAIVDVAQRWRLASSGSQGLRKYLVLLRHPLRDAKQDVVVYLKQSIPSDAEREGVVPTDPRPAGQRVKESLDRMTDPPAYLNSWCRIGSDSYWLSVKEPWSDELDPDAIKSFDDLKSHVRIWATVAGAVHRRDGRYAAILPKLTPALTHELARRCAEYLAVLHRDFDAFKADPRVEGHERRAKAAIAEQQAKS